MKLPKKMQERMESILAEIVELGTTYRYLDGDEGLNGCLYCMGHNHYSWEEYITDKHPPVVHEQDCLYTRLVTLMEKKNKVVSFEEYRNGR